jgi:hypothetical protein
MRDRVCRNHWDFYYYGPGNAPVLPCGLILRGEWTRNGRSKSSGKRQDDRAFALAGVAPPTSYVGWIARVFGGSNGVFIAGCAVSHS